MQELEEFDLSLKKIRQIDWSKKDNKKKDIKFKRHDIVKSKLDQKIQVLKKTKKLMLQEFNKVNVERKQNIFFPDYNATKLFQFISQSGLLSPTFEVTYWPLPEDDIFRKSKFKFWDWVRWLGHTIPTKCAIRDILRYIPRGSKVLSVGSGVALWERLLNEESIRTNHLLDIVCIDACPCRVSWMLVQQLSVSQIDEVTANVLLIIWPYYSGYDMEILEKFKGKWIIFIGLGIYNDHFEKWEPSSFTVHPQEHEYDFEHWCVGSNSFIYELSKWKNIWTCELPSIEKINYKPILFIFQRPKSDI